MHCFKNIGHPIQIKYKLLTVYVGSDILIKGGITKVSCPESCLSFKFLRRAKIRFAWKCLHFFHEGCKAIPEVLQSFQI